jgi:hypothetical protein
MRTVDAMTQQAIQLIQRLLDFFEERITESRPLISKDISFFTFSRFEKLSKLLHDFRKHQPHPDSPFNTCPRLLATRAALAASYLDPALINDLLASVDNAWPFLENTFCDNVDVTDLKKEVTIKLKCQAHSEFSNDREDIAVISLILVEEFCRLVDQIAEALRAVFLNEKVLTELSQGDPLDVAKGFTRFFEKQKSHKLLTDFYQSLARYLASLTDGLEASVRAMKLYRAKKVEEKPPMPLLITHKQTVYKDFVQKKISGLIGMIQQKSKLTQAPKENGLDQMTTDFLSNIVNEVSMQQFEEHLKELGSLSKPQPII